jgi:hypothetical protein
VHGRISPLISPHYDFNTSTCARLQHVCNHDQQTIL